MYSDVVRRLVNELPNRGPLAGATHSGRAENPLCGDLTLLHLRVDKGLIQECRFQAQGCAAAVAAAGAVTEMIRGKSIEDCLALSQQELLDYLQGLPSHKVHGADLALEALRTALTTETWRGGIATKGPEVLKS